MLEVVPSGWVQTSPGGGHYNLRLTDRGASGLHFGNYGLCRRDLGTPLPRQRKYYNITGVVFNGKNGNGLKDKIEPGMAGWSVQLVKPDRTGVFATTRSDGSYRFTGLPAGKYNVSEVGKPYWARTCPTGWGIRTVTLSGADVSGMNFGNKQTRFTISGTLFNDPNGNGRRDAGEAGLSGWVVVLTRPDRVIIRGITRSTGEHPFSNLVPGTYNVAETLKSGWRQTSPGSYSAKINASDIAGRDFGNRKIKSLDAESGETVSDETVSDETVSDEVEPDLSEPDGSEIADPADGQ